MKNVLITYQIPQEGLIELNRTFNVSYPPKTALSKQDILEIIDGFEAVITAFGHPFPKDVIQRAQRLKIISNFGGGTDNIAVDAASRKGILVTNTPDAVTEPTAEFTIALMLATARRISEMDRKIRFGDIRWGIMTNLGHTLYGKKLGIIGLGQIGKAVALRARAMGMEVSYYNRRRLSREDEKRFGVQFLLIQDLLSLSDMVSLHIPLSQESHHFIGMKEFKMMKSDAILINTSRGAVVDEKALIKALDSGIIAGAGLDVYENEPHIPDALTRLDQVVLTPHVGTATVETRMNMAEDAARNIIDYFKGLKPKYMVNPQVYVPPSSRT